MEKKGRFEVPTFLKWAGGKKQLLAQFNEFFPKDMETYVEPFLGGGAVLFYVLKYKLPKKAYVYDINAELINVYIQIKNNPKGVLRFLQKYQDEHNTSIDPKIYYYDRREEYNSKLRDKARKAALFIYLNKTCYNGLYRVNSLNEFNVPFGKYSQANIFDEDTILEASKLLKGVILKSLSFKNIKFPKNSFIYLDPPYWLKSKNNGFTNYSKLNFTKYDQRDLIVLLLKLNENGCKLVLSNRNNYYIRNLKNSKFNIHKVTTRYMINCNGNGRVKLKELLVANY